MAPETKAINSFACLVLMIIGCLSPTLSCERGDPDEVIVDRSQDVGDRLLFRECRSVEKQGSITIRCFSGFAKDCELTPVSVRDANAPQLASAKGSLHCGCVVNGGYFDARFQPLGLFRTGGKEIAGVADVRVANGAIVFRGNGVLPQIVPIDSPAVRSAAAVRQCGPLLIGSSDRPGDWRAKAARTAVILSGDRVGLLTTSACTLEALQSLIQHHADALGVPGVRSAVNLDGGPSSGMVVFQDGQAIAGAEPAGRVTDAMSFGQ